MAKKLSLEEVEQFVKDTLENPENIIKMIQKHGKDALSYIEHGSYIWIMTIEIILLGMTIYCSCFAKVSGRNH